MLSGTPMQNHLDEFYAMVGFCNPGLLGTTSEFGKKFERPILAGREPDASDKQLELARERNSELSELVNKFVLRRTNTILSKHLPPKVVEVVCCKLSPLQNQLYQHFLDSKAAKAALTGKHTMVLSAITALKKLCNHPKLIYDMVNGAKNTGVGAAGFESCLEFFQPGMYDVGRGGGRGGGGGLGRSFGNASCGMVDGWEFHSGKFAVLARLLSILRKETKDRIVIISNYTQTLDLVEILCRQNNYPSVRLDGSTSIRKRQKLVKEFNDPSSGCFAFLLSSKAGGCGINLIGGNRLVLFDPDWNPANDKQAAARCWRDGQTKKCYLYRLLATGSIEEKVFQRQLSKESLQNVVSGEGQLEQASMSKEDLRKLFTLDENTTSDTHDNLSKGCQKCPGKHFIGHQGGDSESVETDGEKTNTPKMQLWEEQADDPNEQNLEDWGHHHRASTVPDPIMRRAAGDDVSFVFSLQVEGCAVVDKNKETAKETAKEGGPTSGVPTKVPIKVPTKVPTTTPVAPGYRLGGGAGLRRPLASVAPNKAMQPVLAKPVGAPRITAPRAPAAAAAPKAKPEPKAERKGKDLESEDEASEDFGDSESEEEASASESDSEPVEKTKNPKTKNSKTPLRVAARPVRRAASKPPLVEVDSSDTDDDEVVYREVLEKSKEDALKDGVTDRKTEDEGGLGLDSDSDLVSDSDAVGDSDLDADPELPKLLTSGGKRARPTDKLVNRASAAAGAGKVTAGIEVDAKRGRKSEGNGSVPSLLQGAVNLENFEENGHGLDGLANQAGRDDTSDDMNPSKPSKKSNSKQSLSSVSELFCGSPSLDEEM